MVYSFSNNPDIFLKVTHPGQAGLTIVTHRNSQGDYSSAIGSAAPAEYMERMIITNEVFGTQISDSGVVVGDQSYIIVSQPKLKGTLPEQTEITVHLRDKLGFDHVVTLISGRKRGVYVAAESGSAVTRNIILIKSIIVS